MRALELRYLLHSLIPLKTARILPLPWFPSWNYHLLQGIFADLPHHASTDRVLEFLVRYPFPCTWIFSLVFFLMWRKNDEHGKERRFYLLKGVIAVVIAVLLTLTFRPWIRWPAPARSVAFRALFPRYLWGEGTSNSFPSHSTLVYFMVSLGFWPVARTVSIALALWTFIFISLPRVYLGGHYPIDVLASVALGSAVLAVIWQWRGNPVGCSWLVCEGRQARMRNLLLLLWVVELADGFRIAELLFTLAQRLVAPS